MHSRSTGITHLDLSPGIQPKKRHFSGSHCQCFTEDLYPDKRNSSTTVYWRSHPCITPNPTANHPHPGSFSWATPWADSSHAASSSKPPSTPPPWTPFSRSPHRINRSLSPTWNGKTFTSPSTITGPNTRRPHSNPSCWSPSPAATATSSYAVIGVICRMDFPMGDFWARPRPRCPVCGRPRIISVSCGVSSWCWRWGKRSLTWWMDGRGGVWRRMRDCAWRWRRNISSTRCRGWRWRGMSPRSVGQNVTSRCGLNRRGRCDWWRKSTSRRRCMRFRCWGMFRKRMSLFGGMENSVNGTWEISYEKSDSSTSKLFTVFLVLPKKTSKFFKKLSSQVLLHNLKRTNTSQYNEALHGINITAIMEMYEETHLEYIFWKPFPPT